ncbi:PIN domain-containing protein [Streptomyces sp. CA-106110]|uniref:PIN domain-containing protein n=1 Tax=Streptomyces sp. CA-106110 TaxID=3240044 RepID=UPI003D8F0A67
MMHSARDKAEAARLAGFLGAFDYLHCVDEVWDRALEVQQLALQAGFHRATSMADLLISATAERHGAVVLHYDGDFEMIASLTRQSHRWVVTRAVSTDRRMYRGLPPGSGKGCSGRAFAMP